jgi:hypothetical protein
VAMVKKKPKSNRSRRTGSLEALERSDPRAHRALLELRRINPQGYRKALKRLAAQPRGARQKMLRRDGWRESDSTRQAAASTRLYDHEHGESWEQIRPPIANVTKEEDG